MGYYKLNTEGELLLRINQNDGVLPVYDADINEISIKRLYNAGFVAIFNKDYIITETGIEKLTECTKLGILETIKDNNKNVGVKNESNNNFQSRTKKFQKVQKVFFST